MATSRTLEHFSWLPEQLLRPPLLQGLIPRVTLLHRSHVMQQAEPCLADMSGAQPSHGRQAQMTRVLMAPFYLATLGHLRHEPQVQNWPWCSSDLRGCEHETHGQRLCC